MSEKKQHGKIIGIWFGDFQLSTLRQGRFQVGSIDTSLAYPSSVTEIKAKATTAMEVYVSECQLKRERRKGTVEV